MSYVKDGSGPGAQEMEWSQVTAVFCHVPGRAQAWPYEDEEEDVWMPAKGHTTVKDTLCNWVKWKRILGELKENCKALNSQPVKTSEISWAYSPRIPSSVISRCQRCAWGLPFSWNSLFFETQIWVPGAEGSCIMLWLLSWIWAEITILWHLTNHFSESVSARYSI